MQKGERKMDEQRRPRSREKKVVSEGKGVEKKGQGLGTGPVNNTGNYAERKEQMNRPSQGNVFSQQRPVQGSSFVQHGSQGTERPSVPQQPRTGSGGSGHPFGQSRPVSGKGIAAFSGRRVYISFRASYASAKRKPSPVDPVEG